MSAKTPTAIFCNNCGYFEKSRISTIRTPFSAETLPIPNLHSTHRSPTINSLRY